MNYTTNYNLKKPAGSDAINVGDFNDNADTLDTTLKSVSDTAAAKYTKPAGGIPETDLASAVQTAIAGKYVKPATGIPSSDLSAQISANLKTVITCECASELISSGQDLTNWEINQVSVTYAELTDALTTACAQGKNNVLLVVYATREGSSGYDPTYVFHLESASLNVGGVAHQGYFSFTRHEAGSDFYVESLTLSTENNYPAYDFYQSIQTIDSSANSYSYPSAVAVKNYLTANYSTTAQMNTAIATAIGNAIGGAY